MVKALTLPFASALALAQAGQQPSFGEWAAEYGMNELDDSPTPPAPTPPAPTPGGHHYGGPPCQSDETELGLSAWQLSTCTPLRPKCDCPTDLPSGASAMPKCVYGECLLQCSGHTDSGDSECGEGGSCIYRQCWYPPTPTPPAPTPPAPTPPAPTPPAPTPPAPTPPAPTPGGHHYGPPPCQSDETEMGDSGTRLVTCTPECGSTKQDDCPVDLPSGVSAIPRCLGFGQCALQCSDDGECGEGGSCSDGVCFYSYPSSGGAMVSV